ncbi:MAG TPA: HAMP domain-containing sensor histidine kinase, partial [Rhodothermales bacterium]|nr:HAMP domain-containing sensor histidine kinase [Rhodothermales bacterium]
TVRMERGDRRWLNPGRSIFWKVAGVLVGLQVATSVLAVLLSARFAEERSLGLVAGSLRLRLDALAEEVEQRAAPLAFGLRVLPRPLVLDLAARFPDPLILLDPGGQPIRLILPREDGDAEPSNPRGGRITLPPGLGILLASGQVVVDVSVRDDEQTWGLVPIYDPDGFLAGGILVKPLAGSIARELAGTRRAYRHALLVISLIAILAALLLGALFTWQLVRPVRRITRQVERIGAGDYSVRVEASSADELGRLGAAVNRMAAAVAHSIETLRATDVLRRELIANVGHDLRTPLAAMIGYVEQSLHQLETGKREAAAASLATAQRQGEFLNSLVSDLFEMSLLDSAVPPLRPEPVPVAELLTHAASVHRTEFDRAGIRFETALSRSLPVIEADGVRLLRAIHNLLVNARQHTPQGGQVTLGASAGDGTVEITVTDTGPGIPPEDLDRIFDRYYRGADARTRRGEGTGLGLSISRAVARAHGGDLIAESTPGRGSRFTLILPIRSVASSDDDTSGSETRI